MGIRSANISYFEPRVRVIRDQYDRVLRFDNDNSYPQRIREYSRASGTTTACIGLFTAFIEGEGFANEDFCKQVVNHKRQKVEQILRLSATDYATHGGFALHINYNALLQIDSVQHVHWEHVRYGLPDDWGYIPYVAIYDNWDQKNETKERGEKYIDYIDIFNPDPNVVKAQIERDGGIGNYKGQIFYYTGDKQEYPLAPFHSVLEDVQSDAETKMFRLRNLQNGFMATSILRTHELSSQEERDDLHRDLRVFQGSRNAGKILHIEANSSEEGGSANEFNLESVQLQNVDRHFEYSERTAKDAIIGAFNQPIQSHPIRLGGKLGNSEEIKESFLYYNEFTRKARRVFSEVFEQICANFKRDLNPSGDFSIIPLAYGAAQVENDEGIENEEDDGNILDNTE